MSKGDHPHYRRAKGATGGDYARPRVQIGFEKDILREIEKRAKSNDRSFAAEVRSLIDKALELSR